MKAVATSHGKLEVVEQATHTAIQCRKEAAAAASVVEELHGKHVVLEAELQAALRAVSPSLTLTLNLNQNLAVELPDGSALCHDHLRTCVCVCPFRRAGTGLRTSTPPGPR